MAYYPNYGEKKQSKSDRRNKKKDKVDPNQLKIAQQMFPPGTPGRKSKIQAVLAGKHPEGMKVPISSRW